MTIGIYKITNINNNKLYIGSSKHIEKRWQEHVYKLENNLHHSSKLQRSYNASKDKSIFRFEIIEETIEDKLKEREQYYMDLYDSFNTGYNCSAKVDNPKYTLKNVNKAKRKEKLNEEYQEFIGLYNIYQNNFIFGRKFLERLLDKHYKFRVYEIINTMIKWFACTEYIKNSVARFYISLDNRYFLNILQKDDKKEIACYTYSNGEIIPSS